MTKGKYIGFLIVLLSVIVACNNAPRKSKNKLDSCCEVKYLKNYYEDHTFNGKLYVDSIGFLYTSLYLYKLDDSCLIFVSLYKNRMLLLIRPDSIGIFCVDKKTPRWLGHNGLYIFEKGKIDSTIKCVESKVFPFYKYLDSDFAQVIVGRDINDKNRVILMDYHHDGGFYYEGLVLSSFYYERTIKNDLISLRGVNLLNYYQFNENPASLNK